MAFDEFGSGEAGGGSEGGREWRGEAGIWEVLGEGFGAESREIDAPRGCASPRAKSRSRGMDAVCV